MKKFYVLAALAASALFVACNNNAITPDNPVLETKAGKVELSFSLGGSQITKADVQTTDEAKVNSWQLWVFNADGSLDAYKEVSSGTSTTLAVTQGNKNVQVVVNAPSGDFTSSMSQSQILAKTSELGDNAADSFVMVGDATKEITSTSKSVTVNVNRIAARVAIHKVTNKLASGAAMKIEALYVTNVAGDCDLGFTSNYSITAWYNKEGMYTPASPNNFSSPESFVRATPNASVANGSSYSTSQYFYVYPNAEDPADGGTWSPRASKFVMRISVGEQVYYYPIQLPTIVNNHSYEINELIITRGGNKPTDPDPEDTPISSEEGTFSIKVVDWTVELVDGGTITI